MKAKELRAQLVNILNGLQNGDITPANGRNMVGVANQINISIGNELTAMKQQADSGEKVTAIGEQKIT